MIFPGCVGGPSSYLETTSRETAHAKTTQQTSPDNSLIEPVDTAELKSLAQPAAQPIIQPDPLTQSDASLSQSPIQASTVIASTTNDLNAPLMLSPPPAPAIATEETSLAYANIDQSSPAADYNDAIIVSPTNQPIGGLEQSSGFAIGSESTPAIDPLEAAAEARIPLLYASIEHGQCKSGRGPKPKKISARNINPGDPYYIEIRMRHTPLLPVGHTYVAYGRLGADGQILDEKLIMLAPFGGYAGAALASGIPMPGILDPHTDDCRIRPQTAYRVSLNAQRYEKLLQEVQKARVEKPSYLLFAYNCNHFMTRMAQSVGIKPPKNIYVPALEYIYAMIEENEGRKIARR
ncbi:MAG: hypothetical protein WBD01_02825 [Salaquimonas sp.]